MENNLKFILANDNDQNLWDDFVKKNNGSVYQLFFWRQVLSSAYGYKPQYYLIYKDNGLVGIFPAVNRGKIFSELISLPFTDAAGWLVQKEMSSNILAWLKTKHPRYEILSLDSYGQPVEDIYYLEIKPYEQLFSQYHKKTRNTVRKAINNFTGNVVSPNLPLVKTFSLYYQSTMQKVGTLTITPSFFEALYSQAGSRSLFSVAYKGSKIASLLWLFTFNDTLYVWANSYDESCLAGGANYTVYDQAIKYAANNQFQKIIFGATGTGSSQAFFKERWGANSKKIYLFSPSPLGPKTRWQTLKLVKPVIRLLPQSFYQSLSEFALKI